MKNLFLTITFVFFALFINAQKLTDGISMQMQKYGYVINFELSKYNIEEIDMETIGKFSQIVVENDDYDEMNVEIGFPVLPEYRISFHLPEKSERFQVKIVNPQYEYFDLKSPIVPYQDFLKTEEDPPFIIDMEYYKSLGELLNFNYQLSDTYYYMGAKGINISINPFVYIPVINSLQVLTQCDIVFEYDGDDMPSFISSNFGGNVPGMSNVILAFSTYKDCWINYNTNCGELALNPVYKSKYLILAAERFKDNPDLKRFIEFRQKRFDVSMILIPKGTSKETIKTVIQSQYNKGRLDYVLLVGNRNDIPESGGKIDATNNPITDNYYSYLQGNDLLPDVYLGRFLVNDDNDEGNTDLRNIVDKTMFMENGSYAEKVVLVSGRGKYQWYYADNIKWLEKNIFKPYNYPYDIYYGNNNNVVNEDCTNAINNNNSIFVYDGHGNYREFSEPCYQLDISSNLKNSVYPFTFATACSVSDYGNVTMPFGAKWVSDKHGGVTFYGSTVNVYSVSGARLLKKIFSQMKNFFAIPVRSMINLGIKDYLGCNEAPLQKAQVNKNLLFGDPALKIGGFVYSNYYHQGNKAPKHNNNFSDKLLLYPNPAQDFLFVNIPKDKNIYKLEIYNSQGILTKSFNNIENGNILNIENLSNGFYIIKILYNDNTFETDKLIINK